MSKTKYADLSFVDTKKVLDLSNSELRGVDFSGLEWIIPEVHLRNPDFKGFK